MQKVQHGLVSVLKTNDLLLTSIQEGNGNMLLQGSSGMWGLTNVIFKVDRSISQLHFLVAFRESSENIPRVYYTYVWKGNGGAFDNNASESHKPITLLQKNYLSWLLTCWIVGQKTPVSERTSFLEFDTTSEITNCRHVKHLHIR